LKLSPEAVVDEYLRSTRNTPAWDAFFFFRHGRPFEANQQSCPDTAAILETLPLVRIDGEAPEILFSVLAPGTRIMPHHGVTNSRSVVHLPLIIPPDCALRVGGETHVWWPGQSVVFDDTYEHEAWNESGQVRVVLIVDTWNPYLTQAEQSALATLVPVNASVDRALRAQ
jgi:aspartate beta-hydroxylase